jgi:hypothetical protein
LSKMLLFNYLYGYCIFMSFHLLLYLKNCELIEVNLLMWFEYNPVHYFSRFYIWCWYWTFSENMLVFIWKYILYFLTQLIWDIEEIFFNWSFCIFYLYITQIDFSKLFLFQTNCYWFFIINNLFIYVYFTFHYSISFLRY